MKSLLLKTDHELILQFTDGDMRALEALITRHKDKLYSSIYFIVRDKYLAEDIFQDALIKVIDTIRVGRYTEEGKFLPWAIRIAHNLCVDHFRKIKRTPTIKTSDNNDIFEAYHFTEEGADAKIIKDQSYDRLHKMLGMLPEDQREVIILRHYAELSFKDIATLTNCSINTALGRMRYGLINLRKMMLEKRIAL